MFKVSEEARVQYNASIEPYKEKINAIMEKEKAVKNTMQNSAGAEYKKLLLCEDMINAASLYIAQNSLSLKITEVKNNDALNEARKILYKAIIYLEEVVTNGIDVSFADLSEYHETIKNISKFA